MAPPVTGCRPASPQWSPGLMAGGSREGAQSDRRADPAAMEPRPDGRGKDGHRTSAAGRRTAAMEPRPDGRGKGSAMGHNTGDAKLPQWSPGLMAGGSADAAEEKVATVAPQWSPGLMAGGRSRIRSARRLTRSPPQWSPGLMAGGRRSACGRTRRGARGGRNGAPA